MVKKVMFERASVESPKNVENQVTSNVEIVYRVISGVSCTNCSYAERIGLGGGGVDDMVPMSSRTALARTFVFVLHV